MFRKNLPVHSISDYKNLLTTEPNNDSWEFDSHAGSDNYKFFKKSVRSQPKDWVYNKKKIEYKTNEQGFRARKFNNLDWNNLIVILGCSNVFGTGLAEEDTISAQLEKLISIPVINLGVPGASIELSFYNSLLLHSKNYRPKAIIQIWSELYRYVELNNKKPINYIPCEKNYDFRKEWQNKSIFFRYADNQVWKNETIYCEASFFENTSKTFEIEHLDKIDLARDLSHPGIESNRMAAEKIYNQIIKKDKKSD